MLLQARQGGARSCSIAFRHGVLLCVAAAPVAVVENAPVPVGFGLAVVVSFSSFDSRIALLLIGIWSAVIALYPEGPSLDPPSWHDTAEHTIHHPPGHVKRFSFVDG